MPAQKKLTNVLEASGAFDHNPQRRNKDEPDPVGVLGDPPTGFTPAQKRTWKEIQDSSPPGVFGAQDRIAMEMCVKMLCQFRSGKLKTNLYIRLESLLCKFGMTPADRSRVKSTKPKTGKGWDSV